jgi:signal peptidase I
VGISEAGIDPDNTEPVIVPEGHVFMMGDNRDNSLDSRFPAVPGQGVGLVPVENLVGRASFMFFSTDGTAEWIKPWTWFTAARWDRIGRPI